jgi:hypothetical protein
MEDWKKKQLDETYKKWEATGILDGINNYMTIHTKKVNMAELMESEASKLLKEQNNQLDELNDYLRMLADMDKIGIRRKIVLLEGYINKVKNNIDKV